MKIPVVDYNEAYGPHVVQELLKVVPRGYKLRVRHYNTPEDLQGWKRRETPPRWVTIADLLDGNDKLVATAASYCCPTDQPRRRTGWVMAVSRLLAQPAVNKLHFEQRFVSNKSMSLVELREKCLHKLPLSATVEGLPFTAAPGSEDVSVVHSRLGNKVSLIEITRGKPRKTVLKLFVDETENGAASLGAIGVAILNAAERVRALRNHDGD